MARNGLRSVGITEAIENAKDMLEKVENLSSKFDRKSMLFLQTYEATT